MKILPEQMRLYAVTDRTWLHGRNLIDVVSEAIDGEPLLCSFGKKPSGGYGAFGRGTACRGEETGAAVP